MIDQGKNDDDELPNFAFRGFKGDYEIKLFDGANEIKEWKMNLDEDSEWILSLEWNKWVFDLRKNKQCIKMNENRVLFSARVIIINQHL